MLHIDPNARAETLGVDDFQKISEEMQKSKKNHATKEGNKGLM